MPTYPLLFRSSEQGSLVVLSLSWSMNSVPVWHGPNMMGGYNNSRTTDVDMYPHVSISIRFGRKRPHQLFMAYRKKIHSWWSWWTTWHVPNLVNGAWMIMANGYTGPRLALIELQVHDFRSKINVMKWCPNCQIVRMRHEHEKCGV